MLLVNIINRHDNNIQKLDRTLFGIQKPCYKDRESISISQISNIGRQLNLMFISEIRGNKNAIANHPSCK